MADKTARHVLRSSAVDFVMSSCPFASIRGIYPCSFAVMKQSSVELSAGIFVLLGLVAVAWFAIQAGARIPLAGSTYTINARFSNAGGLKPGSQVFLAGVPIGRVDNINLDPQYAAIVRLELNKEVQLPNDSIASIRTSGLIGDKFVALSPGSSAQNLAPGSTITDTESAVDLESIISRFAFGNVSPAPSPSPSAANK
jgi:phospholipid/cholesterol/gamma-HCH transport system substrate-binding protein